MDYPTHQYFDDIKNDLKEYENMSFEEFKKTNLALNIFYPSKEYTVITETPKTSFIDLVSNMGGSLGMFLGFSLFSFVELFEILFHIIFILGKRI